MRGNLLDTIFKPHVAQRVGRICKGNGPLGAYHCKAAIINKRVLYTGNSNFTYKSHCNEDFVFKMKGQVVHEVLDRLSGHRNNGWISGLPLVGTSWTTRRKLWGLVGPREQKPCCVREIASLVRSLADHTKLRRRVVP